MKTLTIVVFVVAAAMMWALANLVMPALAQSSTQYSVYCANGKIEVDMRTPAQMKSARGSDVCQLSEFNYLSDAQSFAKKNFGGVGAKCSCR
ncbi:MAG TPA: hypothetical protein DCZ69_19670 [Syntrophobacteraceae bacterium]|jgi:hypothetical protein|nr:hypothetical protein [Syntrophobacteraceae bacterium]